MTDAPIYLSPAFSPRPAEDLTFLRWIDGRTGFGLFWIDIVRPLLQTVKAKSLLEIGADKGTHTRLLLTYCAASDGSLIVIEPIVTEALREVVGDSRRVTLLAEKSQAALPRLEARIDAVLLEGDLNYHSVLTDLREIAELSQRQGIPFPLVFFANASWPYARRDMYYDPESLPAAARHSYARAAMTPWSPGLEPGMINYPFANAEWEGGAKNGVLTAVEEFVRDADPPLQLFLVPVNHGLGIVFSEGSRAAAFIQENLAVPPWMRLFLETLELARLNTIVSEFRRRHERQRGRGIRGKILCVVRNIGRRVIGILEK